MKRFVNKQAFVTGAGQGIGYEMCRQFAQEGARVGLNDVDADLARQAVEAINQEMGEERAEAYPGDVSDVSKMQKLIRGFSQQHGGLHIFVANAGITNFGAFLDDEVDRFDRLMAINLRGTYFSVQAAAKEMMAHGIRGSLLLMSSVCGQQAHLNLSAYGMSKAGIRMLAKSLAVELGPHGLTVNALAPGATLTERTRELDPHYAEGWESVNPNQRVGLTSDVAAATLFLASEEARQITGTVLTIDGGWTVYSPLPEKGSGAN